ncbi:MAG: hypothetical protein JKY93_04460 [Gammaproteobacteria bacterium]|nr:hypothetical protein [Gammaproteobacteria bacterium]
MRNERTITLESDDEVTVDMVSDNINSIQKQITQLDRLHGSTYDLSIYDDKFVSIVTKTRFKRKDVAYTVNLAYMDPNPKRYRSFAWPWLYFALGLSLLLAIFIYLSVGSTSDHQVFPVMVTLLGIGILGSILIFFFKSDDRIVFHSKYGRVPLIQLFYKKPDEVEWAFFMKEVMERIYKAQFAFGEDEEKQLRRGEMRLHRRLRDEGVLPEAAYGRAKALIMESMGAADNSEWTDTTAF